MIWKKTWWWRRPCRWWVDSNRSFVLKRLVKRMRMLLPDENAKRHGVENWSAGKHEHGYGKGELSWWCYWEWFDSLWSSEWFRNCYRGQSIFEISILGHTQNGCSEEALQFYQKMRGNIAIADQAVLCLLNLWWIHYEIATDSCPIGVSTDLCSAGAPWLRKWSTKFIPITPYTRVANTKLL